MQKVAEVKTNTIEKVADALGNTKASAATFLKARHFQLTVWKLDTYEEIKKYLTKMKNIRFFLAAKEIGELKEGEHIHIYVNYSNSQKITLAKLLGAHIEICKGTPKQNIDYVSKQGNIIDRIGNEPHQGAAHSIKEVEAMKPEERKDLNIQYYHIIEKMNEKEANKIYIDDMYKDVKVYYIWGESGVGKTCKAKELVKEWFKENKPNEKPFCNVVKCIDGYWHGIGNERVACIYDDWRDNQMKPYEFIHFIDYNKQRMNVKGGGVSNDYQLIIITSVQDIKNIYKGMQDEEPRKQWERRIKVIHMEKMKEIDDTNKKEDKNRIDL